MGKESGEQKLCVAKVKKSKRKKEEEKDSLLLFSLLYFCPKKRERNFVNFYDKKKRIDLMLS